MGTEVTLEVFKVKRHGENEVADACLFDARVWNLYHISWVPGITSHRLWMSENFYSGLANLQM